MFKYEFNYYNNNIFYFMLMDDTCTTYNMQ